MRDDASPDRQRHLPDRCRRARQLTPTMRRSAQLIWFRAGGPARSAVPPRRRGRSCVFPRRAAGGDSGHGDRRRLQPSGARRRHSRRGGAARPRLRRDRSRDGDECAPARRRWIVNVARAARRGRHRRAGIPVAACPARSAAALRMNAGAYGREIKDVLRRGARRRRARRRCTSYRAADMGFCLSPLRRCPRT